MEFINKLSNVKRWHCLFEQSNTFRDEFRKLGFDAFDYDICNEAGEPDYIVDLFEQIEKFGEELTIFDGFRKIDGVFAFFPCTRFSESAILTLRQNSPQYEGWSVRQRALFSIKVHDELHRYFVLLNKLVLICDSLGIPLVIENPYKKDMHYLCRYWCFKPSVVDMDRHAHGDYFEKPTQYFFFGCEPFDNLVFEPLFVPGSVLRVAHCNNGISRSVIAPQYANRFIRSFLVPSGFVYEQVE